MVSDKDKQYNKVIESIKKILKVGENYKPPEINKIVVTELAKIPYFDWTGIYLLNEEKQELTLDYYIGKPTDHTVIPVGKGVCGSAVAENTDKVIYDVREESNYLACSLGTRSEIVVLIKDTDRIFGQIDVDSDTIGVFDDHDKAYLRRIASLMVQFY
jgi:GAF domain-containing protein